MEGNEPLSGTAISAKQYIFITWPKKYWARNQYDSYNFPDVLKTYLQNLQKEKQIVTKLIDSKDFSHNEGVVDFYIMPDGIKYQSLPINEVEHKIESYFSGDHSGFLPCLSNNAIYIFCCTHGKRDKCCAKFGFTVLNQFKYIAKQKNLNYSVWECTHIGADRLAATAMVFPHSYMYGRLRKDNILNVIEYLNKGYPYPPCFRGQMGFNSLIQTAQNQGHFYWYDNNIENAEVVVSAVEEVEKDVFHVKVTVQDLTSKKSHALLTIILKKNVFSTFMDCIDTQLNNRKNVSRWVVSECTISHQ